MTEFKGTFNEIASYNLSAPQLHLEDGICKNWPLLTNRTQHITRVTANNSCCQLAQLAAAPLANHANLSRLQHNTKTSELLFFHILLIRLIFFFFF